MTSSADRITVFIVDDHAMFRGALRALLEQSDRFVVVGDSGDAREATERVEELRPDIVILDVTMRGLSGIDAIAPIKRASPHSKIVMASQHEGHTFVLQALRAGADGYLSKKSEPEELRIAVEAAHRGDSYLSPRVAQTLIDRARSDASAESDDGSALALLTPREREIFQAVACGKANKQIASELHVSLGTVKKHRENMQRKLDCHSAAELARLAIREGLLDA